MGGASELSVSTAARKSGWLPALQPSANQQQRFGAPCLMTAMRGAEWKHVEDETIKPGNRSCDFHKHHRDGGSVSGTAGSVLDHLDRSRSQISKPEEALDLRSPSGFQHL